MFQWIKRKGTNAKDFGKKVVGVEEIKKSVENLKDMATTVLSPKKQIENAKKETFVQAVDRLKITDEDLLRTYKNYIYCFYISFLFAVICFGVMIYNLFIRHQIISSLGTLSIFCFCLANCFKFSFRSFQIKHQKLSSVKDWWERAGEWFPNFPK